MWSSVAAPGSASYAERHELHWGWYLRKTETLSLHQQTCLYQGSGDGFSSQVQWLSFVILTSMNVGASHKTPLQHSAGVLTAVKEKCSELSANFWSCSALGIPPEWLGIQFAYPYIQAGKRYKGKKTERFTKLSSLHKTWEFSVCDISFLIAKCANADGSEWLHSVHMGSKNSPCSHSWHLYFNALRRVMCYFRSLYAVPVLWHCTFSAVLQFLHCDLG